jgi:hypothetical protein
VIGADRCLRGDGNSPQSEVFFSFSPEAEILQTLSEESISLSIPPNIPLHGCSSKTQKRR